MFSGKEDVMMKLLPLMAMLFILDPVHPLDGLELTVDGISREALIHFPAGVHDKEVSVVFCFHGHGGNAALLSERMKIEELWPDAIVVYPQGLKTKSALVDPEGKYTGWQSTIGKDQDRDVRFFDALLSKLASEYRIADGKVFATGFSNGGSFSYVLLAARSDRIDGIAPIAATLVNKSLWKKILNKPVFHVGSRNDPVVLFKWQDRIIQYLVDRNACELVETSEDGFLRRYVSESGIPIQIYVDDGKHNIPDGSPALVVDFFKGIGR
jgi:polyhydroxybutyrate depolymerase